MRKTFLLWLKTFWWVKPSAGRRNGHAKAANLITKLYSQDVPGVTNGYYHSKELGQGFLVVFPPFGTALAIDTIGFQRNSQFPTWDYKSAY